MAIHSDPSASPVTPAVWAEDPADDLRARLLAERLGLPLRGSRNAPLAPVPADRPMSLVITPARLELRPEAGPSGSVWVDLLAPRLEWRRRTGGARSDHLARAVGVSPPYPFVLDATAGLGRDAWLLAGLGCRVLAVERSPVIWALLDDGLARARAHPQADADLLERISVRQDDAREVLLALRPDEVPDVVLIDPMYPPSRRSALPRKEMRLLSLLLGADDDAEDLLAVARAVARRRVVVKRHVHDAPLGGLQPTHERSGRSTRFDVYLSHGKAKT